MNCPIGCGWATSRTWSCPIRCRPTTSKFGRGVFGSGEDFFAYLRDSFDLLYDEGAERPRMMSIGLHMRLDRPSRPRQGADPLYRIHPGHERVWICRREDREEATWLYDSADNGLQDGSKEGGSSSSQGRQLPYVCRCRHS